MTPCYPPHDPRYIDPEELKHATLDQKIAYRKVVEEKRRNDNEEELRKIKEKEVKDKRRSYWIIGLATVSASLIGSSVLVWQEFRKDGQFEKMNDTLRRIEDRECMGQLAQQRLFYDSGELGKIKNYLRRIFAEKEIKRKISESQ